MTPPTKSGTRKLSDVARHVVLPTGITSTGWPAVAGKLAEMGLDFDCWQQGAGRAILAKRSDGLYAAGIGGVVISIPRQVGKTFLIGALVFALCMLFPNLTVVWTAHRLKLAGETFRSMQGMARRKKIKPFVARVVLGSGDEAVEFINGSRILFGARERGFGLGFAGVDIVVLDEAQRLTETTMDDLVPTMNTAPNPLLIMTGTPPRPDDKGDVFTAKRADALSGESDDVLFIEMSADADANPDDRDQWAKANPSYPFRTSEASMLRMKKNLGPESFLREGLGIWDAMSKSLGVVDASSWLSRLDPTSQITGTPTLVLDVSPMSSWSCIVAGGMSADRAHVEITSDGEKLDYRPGVDWVVPLLSAAVERSGSLTVHIVAGSAAEALVPALEAVGVTVEVLKRADYAAACVKFASDLPVHIGQKQLSDAVLAGVKRGTDEGLWTWGRVKSSTDITPLVAATVAAWLASSVNDYDLMDSIG